MISISHPVSGDDFIDRKEILRTLHSSYPHENVAIVGPRRIGKSSIAQQFLSTLPQKDTLKVIFKVHGNMGTPGKFAIRLLRFYLNAYFFLCPKSVSSVIDEIELNPNVLIDVANQIKSKKLYELARFLSNYFPPSPDNERAVMERILLFLDDFSIEMGVQTAIVLDEFQDIIDLQKYKGFENGKLLAFLESIFSDQKNVWYLFTGSAVRMIIEIFENNDSPFYGRAKRLTVGSFGKDETVDIVYRCIEKSITAEALNLLFSLSGGHPFYTVVIISAANNISADNAIINKHNIQEAFISELSGGALDSHCNYLFETSLGRVKSDTFLRELLRTLTIGEATRTELSKRVGRSPGYLTPALRNLVNIDLAIKKGKKYFFADPVLEIWLSNIYGQNEPKLDIIRKNIVENHIEKIANLTSEIGIYFESYMREMLQKFNRQQYAGIRLPRFDSIQGGINCFDKSGIVFGKPSNIEIDALCQGDENWLCEFKYRNKDVTSKDIDSLIRKRDLIAKKMNLNIHRVFYVAKSGFSDSALKSEVLCLTHQELNKLRSILNMRRLPLN